jgi:hypothetical protein
VTPIIIVLFVALAFAVHERLGIAQRNVQARGWQEDLDYEAAYAAWEAQADAGCLPEPGIVLPSQAALDSPWILLPPGLSVEEKLEHMLKHTSGGTGSGPLPHVQVR